MSVESLLAEFECIAPALLETGEVWRRRLIGWLAEASVASQPIKVHTIDLRVKGRGSLARKLARPDRTYDHLWDVTDLLGLRIITHFDDEVDRIGRLLEGRLSIDFAHSVDKRRLQAADHARFGYRSLHYICHLENGLGKVAGPRPRFEIQVRTVLEHAWAEIEHDLGYKSRDAMPAFVRRRLHRLAGLLELVDQEFVAIRSGLEDYTRQLPQRLIQEPEAVPLDRLSVEGLMDDPAAIAIDEEIGRRLNRPVGPELFYPEYLLKLLLAAGFRTAGEIRHALVRYERAVIAMITPYFEFASRELRLTAERVPTVLRGYAIFFVAHAHVLSGEVGGEAELTVDKVMRLARIYHTLDYPDDERRAQRVAGLLIEALRVGTI